MAGFNVTPIVDAVNGGDTIHITNTGGGHRRVLVDRYLEQARAQVQSNFTAEMLDRLTAGCMIAYYRSSDNMLVSCTASQWAAKQQAGEQALGVLVSQGGHTLVVAPNGSASPLTFGSGTAQFTTSAATPKIDTQAECFADFAGKQRNQQALAVAPFKFDGDGYAIGACKAYSRGDKGAGQWWLPSVGELLLIKANLSKINLCLAQIAGAQSLVEDVHISSTETDKGRVWSVSFYDLNLSTKAKTSTGIVRPVTSYS